jgi:hypothetical protein
MRGVWTGAGAGVAVLLLAVFSSGFMGVRSITLVVGGGPEAGVGIWLVLVDAVDVVVGLIVTIGVGAFWARGGSGAGGLPLGVGGAEPAGGGGP